MKQRGATVIEMLASLAVVAILIGVVLPGVRHLVDEMRAETAIHAVRAGVAYTRAIAVTRGEPALLCPLDENDRCDGDWSRGFAVFVDRTGRAERPPDTDIAYRFQKLPDGATLRFRAFGSSRYLRMLPNGQTGWQNGRFEYCPPPGSRAAPRVLVLNVQGRSRMVAPEQLKPTTNSGAHRPVQC